jgi:septum formation protein
VSAPKAVAPGFQPGVRLYLASRSPRRRELLELAGFAVDAHPSKADEARMPGDDPVSHARRLAERKAMTGPDDRVVVAADTVVSIRDAIFEIPTSRDEGAAHLRALSGGWHLVTTGVCVRAPGALVGRASLPAALFAVSTRVRFRALSEREIAAYLASGEADDKAGAYGIQGRGGALVAEIEGSWTNVMGLPLEETLQALRTFGVEP